MRKKSLEQKNSQCLPKKLNNGCSCSNVVVVNTISEKKSNMHDNSECQNRCNSISLSQVVEARRQCFLKTIAVRKSCVYLMPDRYGCSQEGGYLRCVLRNKEGLCNNGAAICDITQSQPSGIKNGVVVNTISEKKSNMHDYSECKNRCNSISLSQAVEAQNHCFIKIIAVRESCVYLMPDRYRCSQEGGYLRCVLRNKEGLCNNGATMEKIKMCNFVERARNSDCDFFENISEQCMLKNGYLGCRWHTRIVHYGGYKPVHVRTYVKRNGTRVSSHSRNRKSR